jgi:hypothetical protein
MRILWVFILSLVCILPGCCKGPNQCHEKCYVGISEITETIEGPVEFFKVQGDLEWARSEKFPDCIVVGKSYFCAPFVEAKKLKRFAAKIGANVILCQRNLERAGMKYECQCNPLEVADTAPNKPHDPNAIEFTSISMTAEGSAAAGPCATHIFSHKIWFLYKDEGPL